MLVHVETPPVSIGTACANSVGTRRDFAKEIHRCKWDRGLFNAAAIPEVAECVSRQHLTSVFCVQSFRSR